MIDEIIELVKKEFIEYEKNGYIEKPNDIVINNLVIDIIRQLEAIQYYKDKK